MQEQNNSRDQIQVIQTENAHTEAISALNPEAGHQESDMTAQQRREANLGTVLILISILFIVCQSVKIFPDIYEVLFCRIGSSGLNSVGNCKNNSAIDIVIDLSHLMLAINSSVNVIIYTLRGMLLPLYLVSTKKHQSNSDFRREISRGPQKEVRAWKCEWPADRKIPC